MKVLFSVNIPAPYRTEFFNELGKLCDLTVCYERRSASNRDVNWVGKEAQHYQEAYLDLKPVGVDKSYGSALRKYIASHKFDRIILTNHFSPACIEAITYCKLKKIPYLIEFDGGFNNKDSLPKKVIKKYLIGGAAGHLTTCEEHITYLSELGIPREKIFKYPFSSIMDEDVLQKPKTQGEKRSLREKLQRSEEKVIVSVGRYNLMNGEGKGFDLLFRMAESMNKNIGIYIIGDEPTERFVQWKNEKALNNVHFVPFKIKKELFDYYQAADLMVLLIRGDVWGLVVNEAMACGLPVITTDRCMAGLEMVREGINGYIVPVNTYEEVADRVSFIFDNEQIYTSMVDESILTAKQYTIQRMAQKHIEILKQN